MPYLNNRRRARSQRSRKKITNKQHSGSPLKRVNAYRITVAKESLLSEQRLLEEEDIKLKNAKYFENKGYCFLLEQRYMFEKLFDILKDLNKDRNKLILLKEKMKKHSDQEAISKTNQLIKKVLNGQI